MVVVFLAGLIVGMLAVIGLLHLTVRDQAIGCVVFLGGLYLLCLALALIYTLLIMG